MSKHIQNIRPLGFQWQTHDPFLFCAHHNDKYPAGNDQLGPVASLAGRNMGSDFSGKDGWSMYHGETVPGFPGHPHIGFETVTIVLNGFVDHSDGYGSAGRYGAGDVQWMTAGAGLQHSEMFPLLNKDEPNPTELFQIWLNLPRTKKKAKPFYKMLWAEDIPVLKASDANGKATEVTVISGQVQDVHAPAPTEDSWASDEQNEVGIWLVKMAPGAEWTIPAASSGINRSLYFYSGTSLTVDGESVPAKYSADLDADAAIPVVNGDAEAYFLILQGKPINEPVVQQGPFVANSALEIQQAFAEYRRTQFGGWPWPTYEQAHGPEKKRFAKYPDGTEEYR